MKEEYVAHYVLYTHDFFLEDSIESVSPFADKILIARTKKPWFGPPLSLEETEKALARVKEQYGDKIEIYEDVFPHEQAQRNFLLQVSKNRGHRGVFIVDGDEVFMESAFPQIFQVVKNHNPKGLRAPYLTFIKDASFCVAPPYETGLFYLNLSANPEFTWGRMCNLETVTLQNDDPDILHFSYIRKNDQDVLDKIHSFMHAQDQVNWDEWYQKVYVKFNPRLKNFHPTHPQAWGGLREFDPNRLPSRLREKLERHKKLFHAQNIRGKKTIKLHLGCGMHLLDGYLNIDLYTPQAELQANMSDLNYFEDSQVDEIFMNAVFEHLYRYEQNKALAEWYRILKPGGLLIIRSIPDLEEVIKAYLHKAQGHKSPIFDIEEVFGYTHGGYGYENRFGQMHKDVFTKEKVRKLLEAGNFEILTMENVCWGNESNPVNINVIARKPVDKAQEEVQWAYEQAQKLIDQGSPDEAIMALEGLLPLSPKHSWAYDDLGVLYYQKGEKNRALAYFIQSVQVDPHNRNAMKNLADLCLDMGYQEEAIQFYRKILLDHPEDVDALLGAGNYALQAGQTGEAKFFFSKVLEVQAENVAARLKLKAMEEELRNASSSVAPNPKLTSIIILAHNQLPYTQKCLESVFIHTDAPFELIVVNNGSTDGTKEYMDAVIEGRIRIGGWKLKVERDHKVVGTREPPPRREDFYEGSMPPGKLGCQRFRVIQNQKNPGFAKGNNQGMALAEGDYLLLLNNDVVVTRGWLNNLIAGLERRPEIGIVGPMSNCVDGVQKVKKIDYHPDSLEGLERFAQNFAEEHAGRGQPVWRAVGFCMLMKREVVEKIGGFDERYGLGHFEDDDFCLRAALAGFRARIAGDCFVHHFGNKTFLGAQIDHDQNLNKNWEIFKKKWGVREEAACGDSYDLSYLLKGGFRPEEHFCPLSPREDLTMKGEELFAQGDWEGAQKAFEEVLKANPDDGEALNNLGVVAWRQNRGDLAASYFSQALEMDPNYFEAMGNLGNCLMGLGEYQRAISWFRKALDIRPADVDLLNALANCCVQTEDFFMAEVIYEKSYGLDRNQIQVGMILAELTKLRALEGQRRIVP